MSLPDGANICRLIGLQEFQGELTPVLVLPASNAEEECELRVREQSRSRSASGIRNLLHQLHEKKYQPRGYVDFLDLLDFSDSNFSRTRYLT